MSSPLIQVSGLRFHWPGDSTDTLAIDELEVPAREHLFINGPSGSGKSTLLNILGGVIRPSAGRVTVAGHEVSSLPGSRCDRIRADHIGYVFQQFNLIPYLSPRENVLLACRFSSRREKTAIELSGSTIAEASRLLERLFRGAPPDMSRSVVKLSVGQQQRVAVARALIGRPDLIIADEPTSSLDHDAREDFMQLLFEEVEQSDSTLIFVSHDPTLSECFSKSIDLRDINRMDAS